MADFSIQDAAFTGFGVVRQHRGCLPVWAAFALVTSLVVTLAAVTLSGPDFMRLQALAATGIDMAAVYPLLNRLVPAYLLLLPLVIIISGVLSAAMNRAVLTPDAIGLAYLNLGPDEFRQMALLLFGGLFFTAIYFAIMIATLVVSVLLGAVAHAQPAALGLLAVIITLAVLAWLAVRLSLASALTFQAGPRQSVWVVGADEGQVLVDRQRLSSGARPGGGNSDFDQSGDSGDRRDSNRREPARGVRTCGHDIGSHLLHSPQPAATSARGGCICADMAGCPDTRCRDPAANIPIQQWTSVPSPSGGPVNADMSLAEHPADPP